MVKKIVVSLEKKFEKVLEFFERFDYYNIE